MRSPERTSLQGRTLKRLSPPIAGLQRIPWQRPRDPRSVLSGNGEVAAQTTTPPKVRATERFLLSPCSALTGAAAPSNRCECIPSRSTGLAGRSCGRAAEPLVETRALHLLKLQSSGAPPPHSRRRRGDIAQTSAQRALRSLRRSRWARFAGQTRCSPPPVG